MTLNGKTKHYRGKFALAGSALLVTLSITNLLCAADIIDPTGGDGTHDTPYFFIEVLGPDVTSVDSITRGTSENPDTDLLSGDGVPDDAYLVRGIRSRNTGLLNTGDINLYISKNRPENVPNPVSVAGIKGDYAINNDGEIAVQATGVTVSSDSPTWLPAITGAYGIVGDVGSNNGNVSVKSTGANVTSTQYSNTVSCFATGLQGLNIIGTNNGNINVEATGGNATASTRAYAEVNTDASARSYATGLESLVSIGTNNGNINVEATGGNATADARTFADAYALTSAQGIVVDLNIGTNNGNINVEATGGSATASASTSAQAEAHVRASGISIGQGTPLTNNGEITVRATAGRISTDGGLTYASDDASAYGIAFHGESGALHSSGLISAQAIRAAGYEGGTTTAYQVYSSGTLSITGYAMKFNTQEQVNSDYTNAIFAGSDRDSVFNNAVLYAYTDNNFSEKIYDIPTLVEGATVSNQFTTAQLGITSPDYTLTLIDGTEGALQQLSIEYAPENSTPLVATQVSQEIAAHTTSIAQGSLRPAMVNMIQRSNPPQGSLRPAMLNMIQRSDPQLASYEGVRLASTDPIVNPADINLDIQPAEKGWAFALPYYSDLSNDASPMGYDATLYGITGGYNHWVNSDLVLGFHAGYSNGDVDFTGTGYEQKEEDVDAGSLGAQGLYRLGNNWLMEGVGSFFYTSNDYKDLNPLNRESGDYNSHGIDANIDLSYVYNLDQNNRLVPSLGLRYLWQHVDSFTADNLDNADVHYSDIDENQLYARAGLDWYGDYQHESDWRIIPTVGIGVTQALTDNEYSNTMTVGSATSALTNEMDDTCFTTNASLELSKDSMAYGIGYTGSYSSDTTDNSVYLQMKYMF